MAHSKGCMPWNKGKSGAQFAWNKGLSKETNEIIRKQALKITGDWKKLYGAKRARNRREKIRIARLNQVFKHPTSIEVVTKSLLLKLGCKEKEKFADCSSDYDFVHNKAVEQIAQLDFAFPQKKIVIECDGDYWHGNPWFFKNLNEWQKLKQKGDARKKKLLENKGWQVYHFWENFINDHKDCFLEVLQSILTHGNRSIGSLF